MLSTTDHPALALRGITKTFQVDGRAVVALHDVTFTLAPGEFVSIVGPSGCGKSTLLRVIAGLETPDHGTASAGGTPIDGPSRQRGIVFQDHRLFPWLDLVDNIALGLLATTRSAVERRARARELVARVGLTGFENAYPDQLSGGMAQRAAIARTLAAEPHLLLLDEPLGALDAFTRERMQTELLRIHAHEGLTMLMVTHDVEEAVFLSDRIVVMDARPGRVRRIVDVPLPKPRERHDAAFRTVTRDLRDAFEATPA